MNCPKCGNNKGFQIACDDCSGTGWEDGQIDGNECDWCNADGEMEGEWLCHSCGHEWSDYDETPLVLRPQVQPRISADCG